MKYLTEKIEFPDVEASSRDGLLAIGGDLSIERLLLAYRSGIFPWYNCDEPILWWSPDPRFVLFPDKVKVSKSLNTILRKKVYHITTNFDFDTVINACAKVKRKGQSGTWITDDMINAYTTLHKLGYAKSVEVWEEKELVAGFYGIDLNNGIFCGESMFTTKSNASKVGFISFLQETKYDLIDCQVHTEHFERLGGEFISRKDFIHKLN